MFLVVSSLLSIRLRAMSKIHGGNHLPVVLTSEELSRYAVLEGVDATFSFISLCDA